MLSELFQSISQKGWSTVLWRVDSWLGDWSCAQSVSIGQFPDTNFCFHKTKNSTRTEGGKERILSYINIKCIPCKLFISSLPWNYALLEMHEHSPTTSLPSP